MDEAPKKYSLSTIIITAFAVIIIIALAVLFYYYSTRSVTYVPESTPVVKKTAIPQTPPTPQVSPTNVIIFTPPETLPTAQKSGYCFASSIAQPFRKDTFRCMVVNAIYDPCFALRDASGQATKGFVYCQVGADGSTGFLMKLTKVLPKVEVPATMQDNWAWYLKLEDGTECSPFTGTRPFFGTGPDAEVAYYGCKSNDPNQQIVLLGDLIKDAVWTAKEAILVKNSTGAWVISSTKRVDIDTVWQ